MCKIQIELPDQFQKGDQKMEDILKQLIDGLVNCDVVMDFTIMPNGPEETTWYPENETELEADCEKEMEEASANSDEEKSETSFDDVISACYPELMSRHMEELDECISDDFAFSPSTKMLLLQTEIMQKLLKENDEYQELYETFDALAFSEGFEKLFLPEDDETLTKDEISHIHHGLILLGRMIDMEMEALYYRGHADCLKYMTCMEKAY